MNVIMGIGNDMRGDDAIGVYVARKFKKDGWYKIIAGQVPEDFTMEIKKIRPELLIIIDAALMNLIPGTVRIVPVEKLPDVAFSTHGMPLSFFINYIAKYVGDVILVGIEPSSMEFGEDISLEVKKAGDELLKILIKEDVHSIPVLE